MIGMLEAHLEDIAVAAESMSLQVPREAGSSIAVDVATLLGLMVAAEDRCGLARPRPPCCES